MMDVGGVEVLVFLVVVYAMVAVALYWIIRLAVRHGIADSRRVSRARGSAISRQQATYDDSAPE